MKPIKKGMTEAVTRDGRKVTQLTWFDVEDGDCIVGVVDGEIESWQESGMWNSNTNYKSNLDIFAHVEYEWQWLMRDTKLNCYEVSVFAKTPEDAVAELDDRYLVHSRIEESKREVQE